MAIHPQTFFAGDSVPAADRATTHGGIRWYLWVSVLAVTSAVVGGQWDIAWHRSIGRDGFWSPPHVAIYLCGVLAGLACGYLILGTSLRKPMPSGPVDGASSSDAVVTVWGLRGPLGAFIAAWGGFTMLVSAPFDNWWHGAYGLDVKILSPPHVVLILGILCVQLGTLLLVLAEMNRAQGPERRPLTWLFLYVGGMLVSLLYTATMEYSDRVFMHSATFYEAAVFAYVLILTAVARGSQTRFGATAAALVYTGLLLALLWILPLVPALPKLGPVYHPVTHLVPAGFPLLLILPALAVDFAMARFGGANRWLLALLCGLLFLGALLIVQWPFGDFLSSPWARNAIFRADDLDYLTGPHSYAARNLFYPLEKTAAEFWQTMGIAALASVVLARLGIGAGDWMRGIRR